MPRKFSKPSIGGGPGDMQTKHYDPDKDRTVNDADKLDGSTKAQVRDHTPKAHTLASHSTKAHSELTGVTADLHHPQAHDLASHTTKAHTELTGVTANQHHAPTVAGDLNLNGLAEKNHASLTNVLADQHHKKATMTIYEARSTGFESATDSTDVVDHPDFHLTETFPDCKVTILAQIYANRNVDGGRGTFYLNVDGTNIAVSDFRSQTAGWVYNCNIIRHVAFSAGEHTIKIRWQVGDGLGGYIITPGWTDRLGLSVLVIRE